MRQKYVHNLILKPLNDTFETKYLLIPFKPDGMKLGRPVANSNSTGNNNGNGSSKGMAGDNSKHFIWGRYLEYGQHQYVGTDNGNFDSRVLSRNHAMISCDKDTGKLYIRDLKSSNGTFLNGKKINDVDVELNVGDVLDLGTDIDGKLEHRKISALVEDIIIVPLIDGTYNPIEDETEKKSNILNNDRQEENLNVVAQRAAFESAMFGDINQLELEDTILNMDNEIIGGIYINNSIGTSSKLLKILKKLAIELSLIRTDYIKLRSVDNYLINFTTNVESVRRKTVELNKDRLNILKETMSRRLNEKQSHLINQYRSSMKLLEKEKHQLQSKYDKQQEQEVEISEKLLREIDDLSTRLEVETYRNKQLNKDLIEAQQKKANTELEERNLKIKITTMSIFCIIISIWYYKKYYI
ncbi:hypothetical protein TBLA_0H03270 [Henningerozyma blattae CBS 6284]|uniref:FHA domain-containing protein n=1 Tax=Henningerozyma blattae (strain ATCC 34711 / CBS 6284 / DSM 70876 / NBRC 10599 / NRRL Y-10934 / UCD 77-7) TaxID=1071380 RepID=I2H8A6_HENB6|nr:hypothetical protein TBLA_0H03270 [Tetrapisispora blattae CBS 6284]CCH62608.1 hypothetical protein TBLA_0H03270 [Tetrapisispora blattae CBS 6284]